MTNAVCKCGHPETSHHLTQGGRRTYCNRWHHIDGQCPCLRYEEATAWA